MWFECVPFIIFTGLSLKTQELTAVYLIMRILCHFMFIGDIYVVLDSITLVSTLWVIYMIRFKLKNTYTKDLDNMPLYYVVSNFLSLFIFQSLFSHLPLLLLQLLYLMILLALYMCTTAMPWNMCTVMNKMHLNPIRNNIFPNKWMTKC